MPSDLTLSRRQRRRTGNCGCVGHAAPARSCADPADAAKSLVDKTVADINSIINSGKSEGAMLKDFEKALHPLRRRAGNRALGSRHCGTFGLEGAAFGLYKAFQGTSAANTAASSASSSGSH